MDIKTRQIYEKLVSRAMHNAVLSGCPDEIRLRNAIERGETIPERCRPGALLGILSDEEREHLKGLTSDYTQNERAWWLQ